MIDRAGENLLGSHVGNGSDENAGFGESTGDVRTPRESKINDLDLALGNDDQVGGLDVAMNDAFSVGVLKTGEDLDSRSWLPKRHREDPA